MDFVAQGASPSSAERIWNGRLSSAAGGVGVGEGREASEDDERREQRVLRTPRHPRAAGGSRRHREQRDRPDNDRPRRALWGAAAIVCDMVL